jgi:hypothetical protein
VPPARPAKGAARPGIATLALVSFPDRLLAPLALLLLATPVLAQKPWEMRVDLPVPVPVELPAVPPTNPFAVPVLSPPTPVATPLRKKFVETFTVLASAYVDSQGFLRRIVFTRLPWPSLGADLRQPISDLSFTPARSARTAVAVWLPLAVDLKGRVEEGRVIRLQATSPDPAAPPLPEAVAIPTPDPRDLELPATPLSKVDQLANPKRPPRVKVEGRTWRQPIRLLAHVSPEGRCQQVAFLACPEGLRPWLLASMATWTFRPATGKSGPVAAWALLDGEVEVEVGKLVSEALRVMRAGSYPSAGAPSSAGLPPGV